MKKAELLLPAGSMEKLITACLFGADAVYAGGKEFSLRSFAGNLSRQEIKQAAAYLHQQGKKLYIAVNALAYNQELPALISYLEALNEFHVDGIIVSDLGVLRLAKHYAPDLAVTISTQASISNYEAAAVCRDLGASRIVLAREVPLQDIREIKEKVDIELEVFVHGAMCVSYSGRCLLSHYMTGRSANRGECAHPCRYRYQLLEEKRPGEYYPIEEDERGTYILNSRDLCLLPELPRLLQLPVDALKVEGRMKSPLYVATVGSIYRQALDQYYKGAWDEEQVEKWREELSSAATRPYTTGFIDGEAEDIQDSDKIMPVNRADFCGIVRDYHQDLRMVEIEQRSNFGVGEQLELLLPGGTVMAFPVEYLEDKEGQALDRARHPCQRVLIPWPEPVPTMSILRRWYRKYER